MDRNDIINKKFSHSFTGYDISEVDLFLDEIIREFDRKNNEKGLLEFRVEHELNVALKYIRLLRHQLKAEGVKPSEIPISILDDLKELTEKADILEETEKAEDEALIESIHEAIAASDKLCSGDKSETEEKSAVPEPFAENDNADGIEIVSPVDDENADAEIPEETESAAEIEAVPTADNENTDAEIPEGTENTAEIEAVPTADNENTDAETPEKAGNTVKNGAEPAAEYENIFVERNEDADETRETEENTEEPMGEKGIETLSLGKCMVLNETSADGGGETDGSSSETDENPPGKGKRKKKSDKKRRSKNARAGKKNKFDDYEEYDEKKN